MKKIITYILLSITLIFSLTACSFKLPVSKNEAFTDSGYYFDTIITITLYGDDKEYIEKCFKKCEVYENSFSASKELSPIYQINNNPGQWVTVSSDTLSLLKTCISYCEQYPDYFDITCGKLSNLWNVQNAKNPPSDEDISNCLAGIDYRKIQIDGNNVMLKSDDCSIDLGAAAKGYIADELVKYLRKNGVNRGLINLGGNVICLDKKNDSSYKIGIQKPFSDTGEIIYDLSIDNMSVVTSGRYQRYFEYDNKIYHHIFDLKTGYPVDNDLNSVSIITESSTDADILSTVTFTYGLDDGMKLIDSLDGVEAIFVDTNNKVHTTSGVKKYDP